uniref:RNase H type-1 domain-containing protein n=1 Tax=Manihot esculenta TaxID=3983 RepID=A0A2C9VS60_MANES
MDTCLMARVMKAKYFPEGNYLNSQLGGNPSMVWRSIWEAKKVILRGVRVRVGDGQDINVWNSPWLPNVADGKVTTQRSEETMHLRVCDLIDEQVRAWNVPKISVTFNERDKRLILSIPLSLRCVRDEWMWTHERGGTYSMKSGYQLLRSDGQPTQHRGQDEFWRKLWKIKAPPKMLDLLWRAANNCLPTKHRLLQKHIIQEDTCPVCSVDTESSLHILSTCEFAKSCWSFAGLSWPVDRNRVVWSQKYASTRFVVCSAFSFLHSWRNARDFRPLCRSGQFSDNPYCKWKKPDAGWTKANVDAAVFESKGAVGAVFRDDVGRFVGGYSKIFEGISDPTLLEMLAIRESLSWLKNRGRSKVIVESDCQVAVDQLGFLDSGSSMFLETCRDCQYVLSTLQDVRVEFIRRTANFAAHPLVRAAQFNSGLSVWGFTPPDCIIAALAADLQ